MLTPLEQRFYQIVGERVRELRGERLTQERLAGMVGVKRTSITNLERGNQKVPLHFLVRLSKALGCDFASLLPTDAELAALDRETLPVTSTPFKKMPSKTSEIIRKYTIVSREESK